MSYLGVIVQPFGYGVDCDQPVLSCWHAGCESVLSSSGQFDRSSYGLPLERLQTSDEMQVTAIYQCSNEQSCMRTLQTPDGQLGCTHITTAGKAQETVCYVHWRFPFMRVLMLRQDADRGGRSSREKDPKAPVKLE